MSSVSGALATTSAARPPSVTTSSRFFIAIGVTDGGRAVDVVANAPETEDHYFLVPKVVE